MGTVITNLKARFGVENSDFKKGLKENENSLQALDKKVQKTVLGLKDMLSPLALLGAAGGAFALLKGAMMSIEGVGDRLEAVFGGMKEAFFEFQRAIGTLDFSNFFGNISDAYDRGKKFTELIDGLADKTAYDDYKIAALKRESEVLQEIVKDKQKELSVRADAAEKVKAIEEKILKRKQQLAQQEFDIAKGQWEERNRMEASEAVKLYEIIDEISPELQKRIQAAFEGAKMSELGSVKDAIKSVTFGQHDPQLFKEVGKDTLETYGKFFALLESGERDVLIKLFNTFKNIDEKGYKAQADYNGIIAMTTKLLAKEDAALQSKQKTLSGITKEQQKQIELENLKKDQIAIKPVDISNIKMPDLTPVYAGIQKAHQAVTSFSVDIAKEINASFESAAMALGEFFGALASGQAGAGDFVKVIGGVFADLAITVGKICIAAALAKMALDKALISFGGAGLALAAGIALVAIGSAVKGSLAKAAGSTGGSASVSANSFTYDSSTNKAPEVKPLDIHITGKLIGEGSSLAAVIEYETRRKKSVT